MPEPASSFEHEALEADIKRLAEEVQKHREAPETKNMAGAELLRRAIRTLPPATGPAAPSLPQKSSGPLPAYAEDAPDDVKLEIEYLLDVAIHHGISRALAEAKKAPDFVKDAFHDALAGKLYPEMKKRGLL